MINNETKQKINNLFDGLNNKDNWTEEWKKRNTEWKDGALIMPDDEVARRQKIQQQICEVVRQENVDLEQMFDQNDLEESQRERFIKRWLKKF